MGQDGQASPVSLGCGTLILMALIVLIFSGSGHDELKDELRRMRTDVTDMKAAIEMQRSTLHDIQVLLETSTHAEASPMPQLDHAEVE